MPTLPSPENVRKAREQATVAVSGALEHAKTPLLAVFGAGDLAAKAMADVLNKAREKMTERDETGKETVDLRKVMENYSEAVVKQYKFLAKHGEEALEKLRAQPQVKKAIDQVEDAKTKALHQVETTKGLAVVAMEDARGLADEVLGKVAYRSRTVGEKAAVGTEKAADDVASATRSASRKVAATASQSRTASGPSKSTTSSRTTTTRK